jgi:hypothetical protein
VKRGLIVWDPDELPRAALDLRIERLRKATLSLDAPAALVASDVWRSNHARALVNFMPFWSRSLLVVPLEGEPVLICGHSPRVYAWVRTVTIADLRPGGSLVGSLVDLVAEKGWARLAAVDRGGLPYDIHTGLAAAKVELLDLPPADAFDPRDSVERGMRKNSVETTRRLVEASLASAPGENERALVSRLERALRRGGMEDVVLWVSDGESAPRPPTEAPTRVRSSVVVASEYRGHWCQVARPLEGRAEAREAFVEKLDDARNGGFDVFDVFDLGGAHPFRALAPRTPLEPGRFVALHARTGDGRYYGDTCVATSATAAVLL